ncbi:MAG TPA: aminotransferase class V-fold PLP-dependent enzyme [Acidimicrobiales bacterium]|nr:aminotransferase class V-fold PLP-dependent enzyme [Acidimicrobiales bacterium]
MECPLDRSLFPVSARWAYLNHAGVCAPPTVVAEAVIAATRESTEEGSLVVDAHEERAEGARGSAAALMGVAPDEVAFVKNTTEGLAFVANGIDWEPGDRVVVPACEFPSNLFPWLALRDRGVTVDLVRSDGATDALSPEAFAAAISTGRPPRLVVTSWVQFGRGYRVDLEAVARLAHQAGALFCVDAIQALGVVPAAFDEWGVDFAAADAHKWLLGPLGVGVMYVRRTRLDDLRPSEPGWASVADRHNFDHARLEWDGSARRYEGGSVNLALIHGLGAALDLVLAAGPERVWEHVQGVCDRAVTRLSEVGAQVVSERAGPGRSGIVTFTVAGRGADEVVSALRQRGVVGAPRGGGVRISPHGFNDEEDVERLVETVAALA